MKTLTKDFILNYKQNQYLGFSESEPDKLTMICDILQSFSDQENARLTAINKKQAELIKQYKEYVNYINKPPEQQYGMTRDYLREDIKIRELEIIALLTKKE